MLIALVVQHTCYKVCTQKPANESEGFKFGCPYCGQGFDDSRSRYEHISVPVCLEFGAAPAIPAPPMYSPPVQTTPSQTPSQPTPQPYTTTSNQGATVRSSPTPAAPAHTLGGAADPYAHLTPEKLEELHEELRRLEILYRERFAAARALADPDERRSRYDGLKNAFATRQSMARKKYGVRLRERRTKEEIQAEKQRVGIDSDHGDGSPAPSSRDASQTYNASTGQGPAVTPASSQVNGWGGSFDAKRARTDTDFLYHREEAHDPVDLPSAERKRKMPSRSSIFTMSEGAVPAKSSLLDASGAPAAAQAAASQAGDADMSDSSSDNDDIPAQLPVSVRQSLNPSQR